MDYQEELKRQEQRNDILNKMNSAGRNRDNYERYLRNAENAVSLIESAKGGLEFMDGSQKDNVAVKVEAGIYPRQDLLNNLGLIYDDSFAASYAQTAAEALSRLDSLIVELRIKFYEYENEVYNLSNMLAYL